jgi:hypothetical protein
MSALLTLGKENDMKKWILSLAVAGYLFAPQFVVAQDGDDDEAPETAVVTMSKFKVPFGEDRGKVMEFIERVTAPAARLNPNVLGFYVLTHNYGADSRDVILVRVYDDFSKIEAPCGEPCETWFEENFPEEGTPERDEIDALGEVFGKYYARHSDEILTSHLDLAKQ